MHPNAEGVRRVFDAFGGGDTRALVDVLADDIVWRVVGSVAVARDYRWREDVFTLFRLTRTLTDGTYRSRLLWTLADDEHAVAVYRASGTREGRVLDIDQVLLITVHEGRWTEVVALPTDPTAFEAFWA